MSEPTAPTTPTVITAPAEMTRFSAAALARGQRLAFVPTLGGLHAGHLSLLEEGRRRGDQLALSIFVNPTQFGPNEDLAKYPRDLDSDLALAATAGVDVAFVPSAADMYPKGFQTFVDVRELSRGLCGERRPGHFVGVATVVAKLFNIVRPQVALFGEKDFQQLAVVRRMVRDLDMGVEIVALPTVREADGLAMSTRNRYLSPPDRQRAAALYRALSAARQACADGEARAAVLINLARAVIAPAVDRIDYLEIRDSDSLTPVDVVNRPAVMLVAAFIAQTRLIDNVALPA
jgi:pantoate--beta-alanine ligase